jgi:hypothetical protein
MTLRAKRKKAKYAAAWYRKNRRKSIRYAKNWQRKNRKRLLEQKAEHRRKNRKAILAYKAIYRRKNRVKILKSAIDYYWKNQKKIAKKSAIRNRTMAQRHWCAIRRAKKLAQRGIEGGVLSLAQHRVKLYYCGGRQKPCHYCFHENGKVGSGLDRKDSNIGYTNANTVPCCHGCNSWKSHVHSYRETMAHFKPMRDAARKSLGGS